MTGRVDVMLLKGTYTIKNQTADFLYWRKGAEVETQLYFQGQLMSAYRKNVIGEFAAVGLKAKDINGAIDKAVRSCNKKNSSTIPFVKGIAIRHKISRKKKSEIIIVDKYLNELVGIEIINDEFCVSINYVSDTKDMPQIDDSSFVKLTVIDTNEFGVANEGVTVRKLSEIALFKDVSWLKNKHYFVIQDEEVADKILSMLDEYNGTISFDVETTGLKMNMFSKVNSKYSRILDKYNEQVEEEQREGIKNGKEVIEVDSLVGVIFCVQPNVSYYFPLRHRSIKNLYEDKNNEITRKTIADIVSRYSSIQKNTGSIGDMGDLFLNKPNKVMPDSVFMERCRNILETRALATHGGKYEWKVCYNYSIVANIVDDSMILHELLFRFKDATSNRGEPSNLKYLTRKWFGVDQLDLRDFFDSYEEEGAEVKSTGSKKKKKRKSDVKIDFSYMDLEGTWAYGPADGDFTLQLCAKQKAELAKPQYAKLANLYKVEMLTMCLIGYMEYFGHRIDESKIEKAKDNSIKEMNRLEKEIRDMAGIKEHEELKLSSPAQVAHVFYDVLNLPERNGTRSVGKATLEQFVRLKNDDGSLKYPIVKKYQEWKSTSTLLTKFFDNLPAFMYPGGYVFSSFGQIDTATGRMNCKKPNAQQYPEDIKAIVIPREDCVFLDADYSQIEYRMLVGAAKEQWLIDSFKDPDMDYHTLQASNMYDVAYEMVSKDLRSDAKAFNFGIPYGMGYGSLAIRLFGQKTDYHIKLAMEKYEQYFKGQDNVRRFFEVVKEDAAINGYTTTLMGRRRYYKFTDKNGNYSNGIKARALRQAGNAKIQGSAADVFKTAMARIYMYIKENNLFEKLYVTNMIHDEVLMEIDVTKMNPVKTYADIAQCMQFSIDEYPPLYIGGGFGMSWSTAKSGGHEIHQHLSQSLIEYSAGMKCDEPLESAETPEKTVELFDKAIADFRVNKVKSYLADESNWSKPIHPAIGNMFNLAIVDKSVYKKDMNAEQSHAVFVREVEKFIEESGIEVPPWAFNFDKEVANIVGNDEEDVEYEDEDDTEGEVADDDSIFSIVEEEETFGVSINEIIDIYGMVLSKNLRICGIDSKNITYKKQRELSEFLEKYFVPVDEALDDEDAMQVVLLKPDGTLMWTGYYVKGITGSAVVAMAHKLGVGL